MRDILEVCESLHMGGSPGITADFIGKSSIWVENTYEKEETDLVKRILYEAVTKTAPGQLSVIGYDSDLSGIFAPFSALSSGGEKVLKLIQNEEELKTYLGYIRQNIQSVQNVIQGREETLTRFRRNTGRAVEGYTLVVLSLDMGVLDEEIRAKLAMLMRRGPASGVTFLIFSTLDIDMETQSRQEAIRKVKAFAPNLSLFSVRRGKITAEGAENGQADMEALPAETIIQTCETYMEEARKASLPTVGFEELEIHGRREEWTSCSVEGLTFSIGKWGVNDVNITIGDEVNQRHNVLITGAVGQGKSNLISVIIHSLCLRYSPEELRLYLLDFKEGVTFKAFSNIGKKDYLPHAEALGLESDPEFGLAVLYALYGEYQRRMNILKEQNVKSIRELREKDKTVKMPRIVAIIDEFQMMFGEDMQNGPKIAELLEKSVRLFRAAGIHFILASQTLAGNLFLAQKREAIFSQVPIRIALKNSLEESRQTLAMNNSAAAFLRPREAVVNLDYGEISQNRKCVVAYADERYLEPLRRGWWERRGKDSRPPYVFESDRRITVSECIEEIRKRRSAGAVPAACVGEQISVQGKPVLLPVPPEPGRNIAVIGASDEDCSVGDGILQSIAVSLALQHPAGDARFVFCDFSSEEPYEKRYPAFARLMETCGYYLEFLAGSEFEDAVKAWNEEAPEKNGEVLYLFGSGMDKWQYEPDLYGQGTVLKTFVEKGPYRGMHFIGWWVKASFYTAQVAGLGSSDAFNSKIFLRADERTVQSLGSPFLRWKSRANRALVCDEVEFEEAVTLIPFAPVTPEDISAFKI